MLSISKNIILSTLALAVSAVSFAQKKQAVQVVRVSTENKINILIGSKLFTSFLFPDTLEKPVLYPVYASNGTIVTRGFPFKPLPDEPTDHPHHLGIWFNFENVNGLDFWNNSFAIPAAKKGQYGWIKTDRILETKSGNTGVLSYHANWTNQANDILLEETTRLESSGTEHERNIDRVTTLKANTTVLFKDAKDGMLGVRVAKELQIPTTEEKKFTDDKGNVTVVKAATVSTGNYITSAGKEGDAAWSTRADWCKLYGKMGKDSISIAIIDHPANINYPTFWHARGYGLFAANPLGEASFTNGQRTTNLQLQKGESVTFRYRIVVSDGKKTPSVQQLNQLAKAFAAEKSK